MDELDCLLTESEVDDDDVEGNESAKLAFTQRMVRTWLMRPFKTKTGGAIEQGSKNENNVIRGLKKRVKQITKEEFEIGNVDEYGLVARREHLFCSSSVDGGFCLYKKNEWPRSKGLDWVLCPGNEDKRKPEYRK